MSVAKCSNPECGVEFRRLGTGKLFVRNTKRVGQKTAWLCNKCSESHDLRFDQKKSAFQLVEKKVA